MDKMMFPLVTSVFLGKGKKLTTQESLKVGVMSTLGSNIGGNMGPVLSTMTAINNEHLKKENKTLQSTVSKEKNSKNFFEANLNTLKAKGEHHKNDNGEFFVIKIDNEITEILNLNKKDTTQDTRLEDSVHAYMGQVVDMLESTRNLIEKQSQLLDSQLNKGPDDPPRDTSTDTRFDNLENTVNSFSENIANLNSGQSTHSIQLNSVTEELKLINTSIQALNQLISKKSAG